VTLKVSRVSTKNFLKTLGLCLYNRKDKFELIGWKDSFKPA